MASYEPDFIERNGTWVLSVLGIVSACVGGVMTYMIRSRCTKIKCCGFECDREVLSADDLAKLENSDSIMSANNMTEVNARPVLQRTSAA